ncbi:hypothetical protein HK097_009129, partial [Rhizophlyctis rosea]
MNPAATPSTAQGYPRPPGPPQVGMPPTHPQYSQAVAAASQPMRYLPQQQLHNAYGGPAGGGAGGVATQFANPNYSAAAAQAAMAQQQAAFNGMTPQQQQAFLQQQHQHQQRQRMLQLQILHAQAQAAQAKAAATAAATSAANGPNDSQASLLSTGAAPGSAVVAPTANLPVNTNGPNLQNPQTNKAPQQQHGQPPPGTPQMANTLPNQPGAPANGPLSSQQQQQQQHQTQQQQQQQLLMPQGTQALQNMTNQQHSSPQNSGQHINPTQASLSSSLSATVASTPVPPAGVMPSSTMPPSAQQTGQPGLAQTPNQMPPRQLPGQPPQQQTPQMLPTSLPPQPAQGPMHPQLGQTQQQPGSSGMMPGQQPMSGSGQGMLAGLESVGQGLFMNGMHFPQGGALGTGLPPGGQNALGQGQQMVNPQQMHGQQNGPPAGLTQHDRVSIITGLVKLLRGVLPGTESDEKIKRFAMNMEGQIYQKSADKKSYISLIQQQCSTVQRKALEARQTAAQQRMAQGQLPAPGPAPVLPPGANPGMPGMTAPGVNGMPMVPQMGAMAGRPNMMPSGSLGAGLPAGMSPAQIQLMRQQQQMARLQAMGMAQPGGGFPNGMSGPGMASQNGIMPGMGMNGAGGQMLPGGISGQGGGPNDGSVRPLQVSSAPQPYQTPSQPPRGPQRTSPKQTAGALQTNGAGGSNLSPATAPNPNIGTPRMTSAPPGPTNAATTSAPSSTNDPLAPMSLPSSAAGAPAVAPSPLMAGTSIQGGQPSQLPPSSQGPHSQIGAGGDGTPRQGYGNLNVNLGTVNAAAASAAQVQAMMAARASQAGTQAGNATPNATGGNAGSGQGTPLLNGRPRSASIQFKPIELSDEDKTFVASKINQLRVAYANLDQVIETIRQLGGGGPADKDRIMRLEKMKEIMAKQMEGLPFGTYYLQAKAANELQAQLQAHFQYADGLRRNRAAAEQMAAAANGMVGPNGVRPPGMMRPPMPSPSMANGVLAASPQVAPGMMQSPMVHAGNMMPGHMMSAGSPMIPAGAMSPQVGGQDGMSMGQGIPPHMSPQMQQSMMMQPGGP